MESKLKDVKSYDGVKYAAEHSGWLILRGSGTKPILRIYPEGWPQPDAQRLLGMGVSITRQV